MREGGVSEVLDGVRLDEKRSICHVEKKRLRLCLRFWSVDLENRGHVACSLKRKIKLLMGLRINEIIVSILFTDRFENNITHWFEGNSVSWV